MTSTSDEAHLNAQMNSRSQENEVVSRKSEQSSQMTSTNDEAHVNAQMDSRSQENEVVSRKSEQSSQMTSTNDEAHLNAQMNSRSQENELIWRKGEQSSDMASTSDEAHLNARMNFRSQKNELIWRNLNLVRKKTGQKLLTNNYGRVGPSSVTALMGPSGAGKTTLLNTLVGRLDSGFKLSGEILLNSSPRSLENWSKISGYVEQEFYAYGNQTVRETLTFTSKVNGDYEEEKILDVINLLGLSRARDTFINNLSGGERKRASIGVELLSNPAILFLDEPTSGLDSFNALNTLELLKKLSHMNKTILVTIHQPSHEMLNYFDQIILLSAGETVYLGTYEGCITFFQECGYSLPEKTNPAEFFLNVISIDSSSEANMCSCVEKVRNIKNKWKVQEPRYESTCTEKIDVYYSNKKTGTVFIPLLWRNLIDFFRSKGYLIIKAVQRIVLLMIFGLAYLRMGYSVQDIYSRKGTLIFLLLNMLFGTCTPIFNIFPQEKRIIIRERRSGMYTGYVSFLAKFLSALPVDLVYDVIYVTIIYFMVRLNENADRFFMCLLIILSIVIFSVAFSLTISVISPEAHFAQVLGSTVILLFIVYSGMFGNTSTIPFLLRWFVHLSPVNYGYSALLQNEFNNAVFHDGDKMITGEEVIKANLDDPLDIWMSIFCLWLDAFIWVCFGCLANEYMTRSNYKLDCKVEGV